MVEERIALAEVQQHIARVPLHTSQARHTSQAQHTWQVRHTSQVPHTPLVVLLHK